MRKNRTIAVDPGYDRVGIAVFDADMLVFSECFVPAKGEFGTRLLAIATHLRALIREHGPESLAIETLFFSTNQKTAIKVAEARGAIILIAAEAGIEVIEYSPQAVKIAVTGSGNARKEAVVRMVERLVVLPKKRRLDDEYDAIALGIAHQAGAGMRRLSTRG